MIPLMPSPGSPNTVSTPQAARRSTSNSEAIGFGFFTCHHPLRRHDFVVMGSYPDFRRSGRVVTESMQKQHVTGGRVVVVTGASAGVGRAVAREFGARGDAVGLLARGRDGLDAAVKEIEAAGGRAHAVPTDVSDPEAVERAAAEIERELGPIDVWVNDAMVSVLAPFTEATPEQSRRGTAVESHGSVTGAR